MKKIIATVLAMVMALALCATAFAADGVRDCYVKGTGKGAVLSGKVDLTFTAAKDPTVTNDKTTAKGNVAYYTYGVGADAKDYVVVSSLADADLVVYSDDAGKNVVMYLDEVVPEYLVGAAITFGDKCGQYKKPASFDADETYYVAEMNGDDGFYISATTGSQSLMVNGKLVRVNSVAKIDKVAHVAVPTVKDGKVTGYTCSKCGVAGIKAANYASIPEDAQIITDNWYFPAVASTTDTKGNTSPKTFDAGIAMYVGMALTSVAGSAVVIGKKKEF